MRTKAFFGDPYSDLGDYDDYDPGMDMEEELYNEYGEDDTGIDLDEDDEYGEFDDNTYDEEQYGDGEIEDEDDGYRQTKKAIWSNMDWDKD
ncbi:MAG: hypothetical protein GY950_04115 [bacterium]|nr:hypothetical protein [bacterium]